MTNVVKKPFRSGDFSFLRKKHIPGDLAGWYQLRTGDYRLRFFVKDDIVTVDKIGHRSEFYDE